MIQSIENNLPDTFWLVAMGFNRVLYNSYFRHLILRDIGAGRKEMFYLTMYILLMIIEVRLWFTQVMIEICCDLFMG